ncbi:hypothetical protein [Chryseolinea lacunae]|uniref:Uncharacterized protein n=1 Tax=Chryseolinea lacunae TaxID=2801331 RepID=A0ABS1KMQ3_9BACT|nr:hypothetical protein [Chryseolinea lacunae]MBL0740522.1 hypothetical protein [Chryseolinea lacunae]
MRAAYTIYPKISFFIVFLFLLSFVAFYPRYFATLHASPWHIHVHYVLMMVWTAMLIVQPWLISKKKFAAHRAFGRLSYFLVPLVVAFGYLMLRNGYYQSIADLQHEVDAGTSTKTPAEIVHLARTYTGLPVYYFMVLILFYPLAILNKTKPLVHAKYMVAASLSIIGPIMDRAIYFTTVNTGNTPIFGPEYVSFFIIDAILLYVLFLDYKNKTSTLPTLVCLLVFVGEQIVYAFFLDSGAYQLFSGLLLF